MYLFLTVSQFLFNFYTLRSPQSCFPSSPTAAPFLGKWEQHRIRYLPLFFLTKAGTRTKVREYIIYRKNGMLHTAYTGMGHTTYTGMPHTVFDLVDWNR